MMPRLIIWLFLLVFMASCLKPPDYSDVPTVKVESILPLLVNERVDTAILRFTFTDGDGDLGSPFKPEPRPGVIYLTDLRSGLVDPPLVFPDLSPSGNSRVIDGEVRLTLNKFCRCNYEEVFDTAFSNDLVNLNGGVTKITAAVVLSKRLG